MSPLKNTDKFFSDRLPPALVKDWRQCLRSRSAIVVFLLLQAAAWLLFFCIPVESRHSVDSSFIAQLDIVDEALLLLGSFALCGVVPFRAGRTVRADTRVRCSNFIMLTPLSARRIVWGTWSSTAFIILLSALCALPLLAAREFTLTTARYSAEFNPTVFDWDRFGQAALALGWLVLGGWMMTGYYMFVAGLPRILRGIAGLVGMCVILMMGSATFLNNLFGYEKEISILPYAIRNIADVLLLMVLFLELARRHYAAPAENGSRSVRLVALLPALGYGVALLPALFGIRSFPPEEQGAFACYFLMGALLADALLPTYPMPPHAYRFWPALPAWCQKPGLIPSALCITVALLLVCLPILMGVQGYRTFGTPMFASKMFYNGSVVCNIGFSIMLCLLITDCLCARSSEKRPQIFALTTFVCFFVAVCVHMALDGDYVVKDLLPLWGASIKPPFEATAPLSRTLYANAASFGSALLLLLFWRGRERKP